MPAPGIKNGPLLPDEAPVFHLDETIIPETAPLWRTGSERSRW
jgi:hypothetical protein